MFPIGEEFGDIDLKHSGQVKELKISDPTDLRFDLGQALATDLPAQSLTTSGQHRLG